jgi:hypothetical protein
VVEVKFGDTPIGRDRTAQELHRLGRNGILVGCGGHEDARRERQRNKTPAENLAAWIAFARAQDHAAAHRLQQVS